MRLPYVGVVVLLSLPAGCVDDKAPAPLGPSPVNRLQGTYTFTAATSPSCGFQGSWTYRADITQSGRDLAIQLWKTDGASLCGWGISPACFAPAFHGQDNPDGVLFFPIRLNVLFDSPEVCFGFPDKQIGTGQARGQYADGRIEAVYDGEVWVKDKSCYASDHPLTFVRR